jgi:IgA Peptidase M64
MTPPRAAGRGRARAPSSTQPSAASDRAGSASTGCSPSTARLALAAATSEVPLRHQVLCVVNAAKYGGAGGSVAVTSTHPATSQIAIHELGHSAFGLADEYGGNGVGTPAGEPAEPNVTRVTDRNTNKWRALVAATTPMPSRCDAACSGSGCVPPASSPPPGAVGTYEGAIYSDCATYRQLPDCYMRTLGSPFCRCASAPSVRSCARSGYGS